MSQPEEISQLVGGFKQVLEEKRKKVEEAKLSLNRDCEKLAETLFAIGLKYMTSSPNDPCVFSEQSVILCYIYSEHTPTPFRTSERLKMFTDNLRVICTNMQKIAETQGLTTKDLSIKIGSNYIIMRMVVE